MLPQLRRRQHPLVDESARGEARQRERAARLALDHAPDHIQLALERVMGLDLVGGLDHDLADERGRQARSVADMPLVDRNVAPPDCALALGFDLLLDEPLEHEPLLRV